MNTFGKTKIIVNVFTSLFHSVSIHFESFGNVKIHFRHHFVDVAIDVDVNDDCVNQTNRQQQMKTKSSMNNGKWFVFLCAIWCHNEQTIGKCRIFGILCFHFFGVAFYSLKMEGKIQKVNRKTAEDSGTNPCLRFNNDVLPPNKSFSLHSQRILIHFISSAYLFMSPNVKLLFMTSLTKCTILCFGFFFAFRIPFSRSSVLNIHVYSVAIVTAAVFILFQIYI